MTEDIQSVIRDVDETEVGLFVMKREDGSVVEGTSATGKATGAESGMGMSESGVGGGGQVERINVVEATPLRERKKRVLKMKVKRDVEEYEPEVYAEAALRFLAK